MKWTPRRSSSSSATFWSSLAASCTIVILLSPQITRATSSVAGLNHVLEFFIENAKPADNLLGVSLQSRIMVPYGPDKSKGEETEDDAPFSGYAYGMGATDRPRYDPKHHYFYVVGTSKFLQIVDFNDPTNPLVTEFAVEFGMEAAGIDICVAQDIIIIGGFYEEMNEEGDMVARNKLKIYSLVDRNNPQKPALLRELELVSLPEVVISSDDCSILAIGHSNPGDGISYGSVTLIKGLDKVRTEGSELDVQNIQMDGDGEWDDEYILNKGMNMPLTLKALEYWDDHSHLADEIDFSDSRASYRPSMFMSPKGLSWANKEQTELIVNMQPNNGILRLDVVNNAILDIAGMGLKNHEEIPVDINSRDKNCNFKTYDYLFAMRGPDKIRVIEYNGNSYMIVTNEGETSDFRNWNEIVTSKTIFNGTTFGLKNMKVPKAIFDPENPMASSSAAFNSFCEGIDCVGGVGIGVGSNAIDYESDPTNPIFHRMVLHGGRGWSIFELPENPSDLLKLVYDSANTVESGGCTKFPWAHNAIQDTLFGPFGDDAANNTVYLSLEEGSGDYEEMKALNDPLQNGCADRGDGTPGVCPLPGYVDVNSDTFGASVEGQAVGVACGRLVLAVVTEKSSLALLYDITEINSPSVVEIFHLSPASETKGAALAYNDGTIGDVVTRDVAFVSAKNSPNGKPGILFVGIHSGTLSWYEIKCATPDAEWDDSNEDASSATTRWLYVSMSLAFAVGTALMALGA